MNHIIDLKDVERIFENVYSYLNDGGYFIFDILNEKEISEEEPFDLDFSDQIKARFLVSRDQKGMTNLKITVFEEGKLQFEENITEIVHDPEIICGLLRNCGFQVIKCKDQLLDETDIHGTTWFIIAKK